jgi:acyl-CoA thioester hydrolase
MVHHHGLRVYFADTDAGGVVYHANYLVFAERARSEALRDWGAPHAELMGQYGLIFVVRRAEIDYQAPARLDDWLDVASEVLDIGGATVRLRQSVMREGRLLARLELRLGCLRLVDQRPARLPQRWRGALERMRVTGDAAGGRQRGE